MAINMDNADVNRRYRNAMGLQAVRPFREDGFVNMLTKYGTSRDSSEHFTYVSDNDVPDTEITEFYESNALFSRIIDLPAEEAVKHGFELDGIEDEELERFYNTALDELDWEEVAIDCMKYARLYGGSIGIMLINDGRGLEEPLDWDNIKSIDDIRVYDRSVVTPDYASMYNYDSQDPFRARGSRLGHPERYHVSSKSGNFDVHESRCLIFHNGKLPENTTSSIYELWGVPEYIKVHRAVRDVEVAHGYAPKMLDRSVQAIYKMKNLAMELSTEDGEDRVLKRMEVIDMARGLLNSMVLDAEGEDYDFKSFSFSGVSDVINTTCNYLSAVTNIPQTLLFGRSPSGMNSTGAGDLENYYNWVERMQVRMLKSNLRYLLTVLFKAGLYTKEVKTIPPIRIKFNSLWSMSETEQVALDAQKASVASTKAQTASVYVQMQAIDPSEVRKKLAEEGEFDVETMLDDFTEEELEENDPANKQQQGGDPMAAMMGMMGGGAPGGEGGMPPMGGEEGSPSEATASQGKPQQPAAPSGVPQMKKPKAPDFSNKQPVKESAEPTMEKKPKVQKDSEHAPAFNHGAKRGVGVIVVKDGKILTGTRLRGKEIGTLCGPGGHVEDGESSEQAAMRETMEEFGIQPNELTLIGKTKGKGRNLPSEVFLCTDYNGDVNCSDDEVRGAQWRTLDELSAFEDKLFTPFKESVEMLKERAGTGYFDYHESWSE